MREPLDRGRPRVADRNAEHHFARLRGVDSAARRSGSRYGGSRYGGSRYGVAGSQAFDVELFELAAGPIQPLTDHLGARPSLVDRVATVDQQLPAGRVAGAIGQRHLVAVRCRAAGRAADAHAIGADFVDFDGREIDVDVGRQVMGRIADLVNQLLDRPCAADRVRRCRPAW